MPACEAVIEQVPVAMKVAVVPLAVHTPGVVEAKETVSPEVAVAARVNGVPTTCAPGLAKVMVCALRTVTVAVIEVVTATEFVTVSVYVVVFAGETLTAVPLVVAMFPGEMIPVPLTNIPVRCASPPLVIVVGLAVKLVIAGSEEEDPPCIELHPARTARGRLRTNVQRANTVTRIVAPFVTKAIERISVQQNWDNQYVPAVVSII